MLINFELENGLKVAGYQIPTVKSVSLQLIVKGGASCDLKGKSGTAHLMEHMLLQGIPSLPNAEILTEYIESRAGYVNAYTSFDTVEFVLKMPFKYLEDVVKIAAEVFFQPLFPEDALEKERQVMLEEIYSNWQSTHDQIGRFFLKAKYAESSGLRKEVGGLPDDVKVLTMEDLKNYYQEIFKTNNTYFCIVGNFEAEQLKLLVEKYFGKIKTSGDFKGLEKYSDKDFSSEVLSFRKDTNLNSVFVDLSFGGLKRDLPVKDWMGQMMLMNVFANLHKSRLYNLLRYKEGLIYSISLSAVSMYGFGMSNIPFECSRNNLLKVLEIVVDNLIKFKAEGMTPAEFEYIRNYSIDNLLMQYDSPGGIMESLAQDLLWEDKIYAPEESVEIIRKLNLEEVNGLLKTYWDFSKINLTVQTGEDLTIEDRQSLEELIEKLKKG
jgi:predicted Zn-dependent peptidase